MLATPHPGQRLRGPVIDPATEDVLAEVADGTAEDALDAVSAAYQAHPGVGREGGREGLLEFSEMKYIAVDW